jgi:transcriptional regulator with XRE-family HTH domain
MDTARDLNRRLGRTIRSLRTAQDRSVSDLARGAGLSKTILARIEGGDGNPSIETLWRVSQALGVPLGALIDTGAPKSRTIPARSGEEIRAASGMVAWLVQADGVERRSELFELAFPAGTEHRSEPHLPGTLELVLCLDGELRLGPEGDEATLGPGDAVDFEADVPHVYVAPVDTRALCWTRYS